MSRRHQIFYLLRLVQVIGLDNAQGEALRQVEIEATANGASKAVALDALAGRHARPPCQQLGEGGKMSGTVREFGASHQRPIMRPIPPVITGIQLDTDPFIEIESSARSPPAGQVAQPSSGSATCVRTYQSGDGHVPARIQPGIPGKNFGAWRGLLGHPDGARYG